MNAYESPSTGRNESVTSAERSFAVHHWLHRPIFVVAWILAWVALSSGYILLIHHFIDPIRPIDFTYYVRTHAAIGAVGGFMSWYLARLVSLNHLSIRVLTFLLLLPYVFITLLALSANPLIAILVTGLFGSALALAYLARPAAT